MHALNTLEYQSGGYSRVPAPFCGRGLARETISGARKFLKMSCSVVSIHHFWHDPHNFTYNFCKMNTSCKISEAREKCYYQNAAREAFYTALLIKMRSTVDTHVIKV